MQNDYLIMFSFAKVWVRFRFKEFSSENIKFEFQKRHPNLIVRNYHWGRIMRELSMLGKIKENGSINSIYTSSRGARILTYISLEYQTLQSENRRLKQPKIEFPE